MLQRLLQVVSPPGESYHRLINQRGFSLIENLVAIAILAIASIATIPVITTSFHATSSARAQTAVLSEVEGMVSDYRTMPYPKLLQKITSDLSTIDDGDTNTETVELEAGRAEAEITYTAIKSQPLGIPEAVRVRIDIQQRRGRQLPMLEYSFETIITQVS